jgi:uncharacterized protein YjbJ (UPF0337 family)
MDANQIQGAARDVEGKIKDGFGGLTGDTSTQIDGKIDQAAGKIQGRYGEAVDTAASAVGDLRRKLNDTVKTVQSEAHDVGEAAYKKGAQFGGAVNESVRENPWLSVLGMAAIGYVASFLIHSPSSPFAARAPEPKYIPRRLGRYL